MSSYLTVPALTQASLSDMSDRLLVRASPELSADGCSERAKEWMFAFDKVGALVSVGSHYITCF